jgi:hypothetical protein
MPRRSIHGSRGRTISAKCIENGNEANNASLRIVNPGGLSNGEGGRSATKRTMRASWIENYAGTWRDAEGRTLVITVRDEENARVTLLAGGDILARPWCGGKPAVDLPAKCRPAEGPDLEIALGRHGFSLCVNYESPGQEDDVQESLSVAICQFEADTESSRYARLFGKLGRYRRPEAECAD